jgi:hypothetical protein
MATRRGRAIVSALTACCLVGTGARADAASIVIGADITLTVNTVNHVGGGLANDTDSTTYDVSNAAGTKKIVGRLNTAMPPHVNLTVQAVAPVGATSAGAVTLTASDQDLVTGIGVVTQNGLAMNFTLNATVQAGTISAGTKTLTLTLIDAP